LRGSGRIGLASPTGIEKMMHGPLKLAA
jgi:hypothetical protein